MTDLEYSIVIVTYRRHEPLRDTLRALRPMIDPARGELIVVDQRPASPLPVDLRTMPGLRYIELPDPGMVAARNVGIGLARGEIVLFLDDDVIPAPGLIEGHLASYADPKVGCVAGRILDPGQTEFPPPHPKAFDLVDGWRFAQFDHATPGDVVTARGCNMSFRREVLMRLGGFDPLLEIFRDDSDMCLRVIASGMRIRFAPSAELVHLSVKTGGTRDASTQSGSPPRIPSYRQYFRHYRDNLYFIFKHFRGRVRLRYVLDAYRGYVGFSRRPWRWIAKSGCFVAAAWKAAWQVRFRRRHPLRLVPRANVAVAETGPPSIGPRAADVRSAATHGPSCVPGN